MTTHWIKICETEDILPNSGVAALVGDTQVAIFRVQSEFYAISDYDPFSGAYVLSRGIVGDRAGVIKVSSPIYKQSFNLLTGECLDDPSVKLPTYPVQVVEGGVYILDIRHCEDALAFVRSNPLVETEIVSPP